MSRIQPVQSSGQKLLLPAADGRRGGPQPELDGVVGGAFGQRQDQLGAKDLAGRQGPGLGDAIQFQMLLFGENYGVAAHIGLDVN
jgi:hypothetical protein